MEEYIHHLQTLQISLLSDLCFCGTIFMVIQMKTIELENNKYKLIENYNDGFNEEEVKEKYTDYFNEYDYIVGDIAYSKLRLKGFNKKGNKNFNSINDFSNLKKYLKENCAYGCKYFVLEKIQK